MQERTKQAPGDASLNALLGRGSQFDGKLTFEGTVRIDGTFTGEISTNDMLIIGEGAKVTADITCGSVIVNGEVNGNIKASEMVELHKPAKVKGDVATPSFMVEKGVMFDGAAKMETAGSNLVTLNRPHRETRDAHVTPAVASEAKS
jgi:cytoskeletal protein CcmA (bactofilin family)